MTDKIYKKADIVSVAKAARVSASTVSRYFNHPGLVKPATRRRIDIAVRKQGYIRNRAAQTIHGIRSGTIGMLIPTLDHAIFAEVVQAFSDAVATEGFTILLASHGYDAQREYAILRKLMEHRVDGVVLTGLDHDEAVFQLLDTHGIPALLIWNYAVQARYPCIGADNDLAGRMIARHVLSLGHRRIACMFPPPGGNDRAFQRQSAVMETLAAAGIVPPENWQLTTRYSISEAKRDTQTLLGGDPQPTALICGNDILATGALYGAAACGLDVPGDMTVTGVGDFKGASEIEPALTTIRLPARRIGRQAASSLVRAITQPDTKPTSAHCAPELMIRASCGPPYRS